MGLTNTFIIIYLILKTITKLNTIINKIENIKINLDYKELYEEKKDPNEQIVITSDEDTKKSSKDCLKNWNNCKNDTKKIITQKSRKKNKKKNYKAPILDILMTDSESDNDLHYNDSNTESKEDNSVGNNSDSNNSDKEKNLSERNTEDKIF